MKSNLGSNLLLGLSLAVLAHGLISMPPGGTSWLAFLQDDNPISRKVLFLAWTYLWPCAMSFGAIVAFQIQMRLGASGLGRRVVFSLCMLASMLMLAGLRSVGMNPASGPFYVLGMASAYATMSHLYAVRMRSVYGRLRIPWPVWRGDLEGMAEVQRQMQRRIAESRKAQEQKAENTPASQTQLLAQQG